MCFGLQPKSVPTTNTRHSNSRQGIRSHTEPSSRNIDGNGPHANLKLLDISLDSGMSSESGGLELCTVSAESQPQVKEVLILAVVQRDPHGNWRFESIAECVHESYLKTFINASWT